ncbi:hypothetical protein [Streptomyces sp. NBC_01233]|uniref:hypothetical protein n=1 Tax=Streptomyces sp. NBC_01233 TaxID=2903787 RepID=UPI002E12A77F|nr:hypothetical protein OG332_23705 [Streptomyces sp. NBC_01233]
MIATTLAVGGVSLASTSAFAAPATTASVTTDGDTPGANRFVGMLGKVGKLSKIGSNDARGGDTEPPGGGSAETRQPPQTPQTPKWKLPVMTDEPQGSGGWISGGVGGKGGNGGKGGDGLLAGGGGGNGGYSGSDVGPRQDSDYAIWTDPGRPSGPVVN